MYATIHSYYGVDQNRTAELTAKINETLVPQLTELPGFAGYYFVDVGNGPVDLVVDVAPSGRKFVRTRGDTTTANNLLSLPQCPPLT